MCRYTESDRIQLFNNHFSEFCGNVQSSRIIETTQELSALIRGDFSITATDKELSRIADHLGLA